MRSELRNLPEQELSIKERAHELYVEPTHTVATTKPFPTYLRETPAVPFSTFTKVMLWTVGVIVALLFAASLWRVAARHSPRRPAPARRPTARSALRHAPTAPSVRVINDTGCCPISPPPTWA
jgi:hypothetical protein